MSSRNFGLCLLSVIALSAFFVTPAFAGNIAADVVVNFDTEDDFSTPLIHGQIVDPAFDGADLEFGNLFNLSSTQDGTDGHLGVTVFDSDRAIDTNDPDLLVGRGNILILQNDDSPAIANDSPEGLRYASPNDERSLSDNGSIVFDFLFPVEPLSIDIIDANGGFGATLTLTDTDGDTRVYTIPEEWTYDISDNPAKDGYATLHLDSFAPQTGERTNTTTVVEILGYDATQVVQLKFSFTGANGGSSGTTSGGIDTLTFNVPEPTSSALVVLGILTALSGSCRRARKNT